MSADCTTDRICRGELTLEQPRKGYRFNIDSIILVDFCGRTAGGTADRAVDLGAGCGVVGLLLARRDLAREVVLVEIQQELAQLAESNARRNGLERRATVVCGDLRQTDVWLASADLVVSNPPFFRQGHGRVSGEPQVALAKHELTCTVEDLARAAEAALRPDGALALIHSMDRLEEILGTLRAHGLSPSVVQGVCPLPGRACGRVLLRAIRGSAPTVPRRLPDLLVEVEPGVYSPQLRATLGD